MDKSCGTCKWWEQHPFNNKVVWGACTVSVPTWAASPWQHDTVSTDGADCQTHQSKEVESER